MFSFFRQRRKTRIVRARHRLARQLLDLQAELEAERRKLAIAQAELDSMAAVIARDRQRVKAETAEAAARVAKAGAPHEQR